MKDFYFKYGAGCDPTPIFDSLKKLSGVHPERVCRNLHHHGVFTLDSKKNIMFYPYGTDGFCETVFNGVCLNIGFRLCLYFKANRELNAEIVEFLKRLGGTDRGFVNLDYADDALIFIDRQGDIYETVGDSDLGNLLKLSGLEVSLSELPSSKTWLNLFGSRYLERDVKKVLKTITAYPVIS